MSRLAIVGGDIYKPDHVVPNGILITNGDRIEYIGMDKAKLEGIENRIPASGKRVVPGFVDIHIHGSDGVDCLDACPLDSGGSSYPKVSLSIGRSPRVGPQSPT